MWQTQAARRNKLGINSRSTGDVIFDLSVSLYPLADCTLREIYVDNLLEHLHAIIMTIED
jgi:hypothetical protein